MAKAFPAQHQRQQPGIEEEMSPAPQSFMERYKAAGKLEGKIALITGGDSGIGRAVAIGYAKEGADVAIIYKDMDEEEDAEQTRAAIEREGRRCLLIRGDIGQEFFCRRAVEQVAEAFGRIDILVNNAAEQHVQERFEDISAEQLEHTFRTNVFGMFFMTRFALEHMSEGACIINTTSVTSYKGNPQLVDYSSTKGAITAFTRALSQQLAERGIRVNGVAPGPIWTPLIPATFPPDKVAEFGTQTTLGRAGQPDEVAPSYIFLASDDASYFTGQILHPNGGSVVNG